MRQKQTGTKPVKEPVVYLGPSIYGMIQWGTVLKQPYPQSFQALLEHHQFLSGLLIPLSGLAKAKKEQHNQGSAINMLYQQAENMIGGNYV